MMLARKRQSALSRTLVLTMSVLVLSVTLTACGEDDEASTVVVPKKYKKKKKDANAGQDKEGSKEEVAYNYDPINRRDPFKTYFDELAPTDIEGPLGKGPLQQIDLDALTLVGVVTGTATPMAMVQDGTGKGYTVKIGTLVGKKLGQIKQIRRNEIVVQETFRDFTGKKIPVYKSLKLEEETKK